MDSISSIAYPYQALESQFDKITLQNTLQDIIVIIKDYEDKKSISDEDEKSNETQDPDSNINLIVQSCIQKQIKGYIDKIESTIKKYWYTELEKKLYIFLTDLKQNWKFFHKYFQINESIDFLEDSIYNYVQELKKQRAELELDDLIETITETFDYWPSQKAQKCRELAKFLGKEEEILNQLNLIQKANILYSIENCTDLYILSNLPKIFPLFQIKEYAPDLNKYLQDKILIESQNENFHNITKLLEKIEESIIKGSYWDTQLEKEIFSKLSLIRSKDKSVTFKRMIELLGLYYADNLNNNTILDTYPELNYSSKKIAVNLNYEGMWVLNVFFKGKWYPAYKLKESSDFADVEFSQEGEWKARKFKCFSWTLQGLIPVGSILKLTNKKEIQHIIISNTKNPLREINLNSIDENLISLMFSESKQQIERNSISGGESYEFLVVFLKENSLHIKIILKLLSVDKKLISLTAKVFSNIIKNSNSDLITMLNSDSDKKFLTFLKRFAFP